MKSNTPISASIVKYLFNYISKWPGILLLFFMAVCVGATSINIRLTPTSFMIMPDTLYEDSTTVVYEEGDTVEIYSSGSDSVYVIYEDTSYDSLAMMEKTVIGSSNIQIYLSGNSYDVKEGLFGMNISDMFETGHANENELGVYGANPDPWDLLSQLKPKTIRVFSGSGSKFMKLMGSDNPAGLFKSGTLMNGGYGFSIERMIQYYDMTDEGGPGLPVDYPAGGIPLVTMETNHNEFSTVWNWIAEDDRKDFIEFKDKYFAQPTYDPAAYTDIYGVEHKEDEPLYINQFIRLIKKIETENAGHQVDVILCLNILDEPASTCKYIVDYLRNNSIWNVNVLGVEIGNECYAKFYNRALPD